MQNRVEVRDFIRYQLSKLGERNSAHVFEQLCFELARARHVRNLLPATGPVQAGGDQGRDFESFRTGLGNAGLGSSSFLSLISDDVVVGACTLQRGDTAGKIRRDLKTIFGIGERPARIIYFCEQGIPVASRHKLQGHCRGVYGAELEIIDGEAIADQLADPDTFWIASQYLSIPAETWPRDDTDEAYADLRRRWIGDRDVPVNHADFLQLKEGLRSATREELHRPDILQWLEIMRAYLKASASERFRQKARYEIAVAELRGRGNLDPALDLVETYFERLAGAEPVPADILDAAVLATFCWGAVLHGQTRLERVKLIAWIKAVRAILGRKLAAVERRGDRCTLLEAAAVISGIPLEGAAQDSTFDATISAWLAVLDAAEQTPFYPIWHVAEFVERMAPVMASRPAWRQLRNKVDELTRNRSGGHAVAEQSERRGFDYLEAGRLLLAIDEFQRAKVGWFSGERLDSSLRLMQQLADCYAELGLVLAARYYAAGATYLALHSDDDDVRALLPGAAFQLVRVLRAGGETLSSLSMMRQALSMHFTLEKRPTELEAHPMFKAALEESAIGYAVVRRLAPNVIPLSDGIVDDWPLAPRDLQQFRGLDTDADSPWQAIPEAELLDLLERELGRSPLEDLGPIRTHVWSALGVEWTLRFRNEADAAAAALGLGAVLQVLQVEMAHNDLQVIPDTVVIDVSLGDVRRPGVATFCESGATWEIVLPTKGPPAGTGEEEFYEQFSVAATMLGQVTALSSDAYLALIAETMEREAALRAYSVRPARELMTFVAAQIEIAETLAATPSVPLARRLAPKQPPELAWREVLAPGYSPEQAREMIQNRYSQAWSTARPSLTRAFADPGVRDRVRDMRADGLLDWQILGVLWNVLCQAQVEAGGRLDIDRLGPAFMARSQRPERPDDPVVDLFVIDAARLEGQRHSANVSALRAWGLTLNRGDVGAEGLRRFLDVRLRQAFDDIPHEDLFGGSPIVTDTISGSAAGEVGETRGK
nr:hypothetical protein [uncultured Brevundimonas sp.]